MAECVECGSYTKFQGGLCSKCYANKKADEQEEEFEDEVQGLSEGKKKYTESIIKGRIAETLIQELFLNLGYSVFRYGMENTIPGIMTLLKGVKSETAKQIRRMPDFVIQHSKTGEVFFIEVKFRATEEFKRSDLPKDYPYENAYIILVSKKHIKCVSVEELDEGKEISPESKNYLGNRKEFCQFAVKFFDFV